MQRIEPTCAGGCRGEQANVCSCRAVLTRQPGLVRGRLINVQLLSGPAADT